jgi:beta-lactamase superfamily II metal-dependent hydrolase
LSASNHSNAKTTTLENISVNRLAVALLLAASTAATAVAADTLDIYFIDVEGGQATLIVTPLRESLLIDTGWAGNDGRDPKRILAAARDAGISQIDYLLITHQHADHNGGAPELSRLIPIKTFVDYGEIVPTTEPRVLDPFKAYAAIRAVGRHIIAKVGERIPLKEIDVAIVSTNTSTLTTALDGGGQANRLCEAAERPPGEPTENPRSNGIHLRFGKFRFVDLGDLSGKPLYSLFCPNNLLGQVELFLVPHHGGADNASPAAMAMQPRVAIMNNGATKGGSPDSFAMLHQGVERHGLDDVWQLDKSTNDGVRNFSDALIANLEPTTGHWIKVSARVDGTFTVANGRTGETRSYRPR